MSSAADFTAVPGAGPGTLPFHPPKPEHSRPDEVEILRGVPSKSEWSKHVCSAVLGGPNPEQPVRSVQVLENALQRNIVVYPNPSTDLFNLKVPASTRNYTVEVTDLTGKVVKQQFVANNTGAAQLNLSGAAKGIYILKITFEGNVATRKLIVE